MARCRGELDQTAYDQHFAVEMQSSKPRPTAPRRCRHPGLHPFEVDRLSPRSRRRRDCPRSNRQGGTDPSPDQPSVNRVFHHGDGASALGCEPTGEAIWGHEDLRHIGNIGLDVKDCIPAHGTHLPVPNQATRAERHVPRATFAVLAVTETTPHGMFRPPRSVTMATALRMTGTGTAVSGQLAPNCRTDTCGSAAVRTTGRTLGG